MSVYPENDTINWCLLFPTYLLLGASSAVLLSAHGAYLTDIALLYSAAMQVKPGVALGWFNSHFWSVSQCSQILGNLLSPLFLRAAQWYVNKFSS